MYFGAEQGPAIRVNGLFWRFSIFYGKVWWDKRTSEGRYGRQVDRQKTRRTKTAFDGNRTSLMSKPDKIPIETKKGACYYGIITYSSTGWKSRDKRFVVGWGGK